MIQDQFKANNIEFAHRNVTVYLPPESDQAASGKEPNKDEEKSGKSDRELMEKAAAAAAIAVAQDEDDAKKPDDR